MYVEQPTAPHHHHMHPPHLQVKVLESLLSSTPQAGGYFAKEVEQT